MNEFTGIIPLWGMILLFLLLIVNGILYGFSASLQNLNETEIEKQSLAGDPKAARLYHLIKNPVTCTNAIPLVVITSGICIGAFLLPSLTVRLETRIPQPAARILVLVLAVLMISSLGILTFRRIASCFPEQYAYRFLIPVSILLKILYPVTWLITRISQLTSRLFGVDLQFTQDPVTEEEIISMVDEAHEQGIIEENEAEMIQNIMSFNETSAADIMTHRMQIVGIEEGMLLQEMVDFMLEEGNSRYPVYRGDLDNIVGIVHYKDALKFITRNPWAKFKPLKEIPGIIRKARFIPGTRGIGDLFHQMQDRKMHIAVVVDEYGQTAGLVTMEDILEEIVGEILDEYDEEEVKFRQQLDQSIVIDGLASLEEVEEELGIHFEDCEFETLNGVLTSILGRIPNEKDLDRVIEVNGYRFTILSLGNRTIGKVRAEKLTK